jgi:hypothetical protein
MEKTMCDCGHPPSKHESFTTGYGTDSHGKTACHACCAENDKRSMIETGKATLYLTIEAEYVGHAKAKVTNWPGSLVFPIGYVRRGRHNIAGTRYDVWFTGPDSKQWHGVQYGDNTQICHCRRVK